MKQNFISIILLISLLGCSNEENTKKITISASACSKKLTNGEIVECEENKSVENRFSDSFEFFATLDESHPGPQGPNVFDLKNTESYFVKHIDEKNSLHIENGDVISFAGLACNDSYDFKRYLNVFFLGKNKNRIHFQLTGYEEKGIKFAYIWEIGSNFDSSSPTNETVISSQWCVPIEQEGHQFHSRYKLILNYVQEKAL